MADITSGALQYLQKALGLAGVRSQTTQLEDSTVQQVIDISQLASASQPDMEDKGIFFIVGENTHAGAGQLDSNFPIYQPSTRLNMSTIDVDKYDVWLHRAWCKVVGTTTLLTGAGFGLDVNNRMPAVTDGATALPIVPLCVFAGTFGDAGSFSADLVSKPLDFLMPRSADGLRWTSQASGAVTAQGLIMAQLVPIGLRPSGF